MKLTIPQLKKYRNEPFVLDQEIDIKQIALERFSDRLNDVSKLAIKGEVNYRQNDQIKIDLNVKGEVEILTSIKLEPKKHPVDFSIEEIYVQDEQTLENFALTDQVFLIEDNQIDINEIVLENLMVELPITVEDTEAQKKGEGWEIIAEENYQEIETENETTQTLGYFFPDDNKSNKDIE